MPSVSFPRIVPNPVGAVLTAVIRVMFVALFNVNHALEGYYKDLFSDAASGLSHFTSLPAADSLNLAWEVCATESRPITLRIMAGEAIDSNGHLLYPDGSPRFRMMYVHGGHAVDHGDSLGITGRKRVTDFYNNGGSYSGSCAGAIFTTENTGTYVRKDPNPSYLHIYPAATHYTQLADSYTDMLIPPDSPLLRYEDFGTGLRVAHMRHNGGNYVINNDPYYWAPGTEILATYTTPVVGDSVYLNFLGYASLWAYKTSLQTGRLVLSGSHPEMQTTGEQLHYFRGMLRYALDGTGLPRIKAALTDNQVRSMDDNAKPGFEKIGDKQYHHFTISIPANTARLTLSLTTEPGYSFGLYALNGNFAFQSQATHASTLTGATQQIVIENPSAGTWYAGVELKTAVTAVKNNYGHDYTASSNLPVLNGISYRILAAHTQSTAISAGAGGVKTDLNLVRGAEGNTHRLEIHTISAGEYEIEIRSIEGRLIAGKKSHLPAGKSHMTFDLGKVRGSVVGVLKCPHGTFTKRWML